MKLKKFDDTNIDNPVNNARNLKDILQNNFLSKTNAQLCIKPNNVYYMASPYTRSLIKPTGFLVTIDEVEPFYQCFLHQRDKTFFSFSNDGQF